MTNIPKRSFRVRYWALFLIAWVFIASAVAVLLGRVNWLDYYLLAKSGVAVRGSVTHKDPANHLAVHYSYVVGSRTYDGIGNAPSSKSLDSLSIGESLSLYYLAQDPGVSCWGDPKRLLANENFVSSPRRADHSNGNVRLCVLPNGTEMAASKRSGEFNIH